MQPSKIVCNRRDRSRSKPAASEGSCGGRSEWRAQSIAPKSTAVAIHSGEKRSREQRCSELAMTVGAEIESVMSGQKPLHKPRSGWGEQSKPTTYLPSAKDEASATGQSPCVHHSSIGWEDGGEWRQCADCRPECGCLSLRVGIASGGFGAHCNWSEPDAGGAAVGVGGKVEMEV